MAEYALPDLDYDYGALEPHISGPDQRNSPQQAPRHVREGPQRRHRQARGGARRRRSRGRSSSREEPRLPPRRPRQSLDLVEEPVPQRRRQAHRRIGRRDRRPVRVVRQFQAQFSAVANGLQGSGWAVLGYDTLGQRLLTFQLYDQQANVRLGIIPLLQVDMWEHAYYLQYKNVKADYVKAFWNVVNWEDVQNRYAGATSRAPGLIF